MTSMLWPDDLDARGAPLTAADDAVRGNALARAFFSANRDSAAAAAARPLHAPAMSLADFVLGAWEVMEPDTPYLPNWHIEAVCEHLEAATRSYGLIRRDGPDVDDWWRRPAVRDLIINIPPGFMKSLLAAVFWPAWAWTFLPGWRGIFCSYSIDLALRDSVRCRDVIESDWYQDTFHPTWRFSGDQNVKSYFANSATGFRLCVSVGGRATGFRGHAIVVDDPLNAKEQDSETARKEARTWWDRSMSSRVNDKRTGARVVIMQRLHEQDLTGHLLERGGYDHLCLPLEFEPERRAVTSIGWEDPRTEPAECLFPEMFPPEVIAQTQLETLDDYAGQYQQRPTAAEGGIFKRAWWQFYDQRPPVFHGIIQSWDMSFKDTKSGSFVVGQVWGQLFADMYLLGQVRARLDMPRTVSGFRWLTRAEPTVGAKYVEDKANGPAVIATLRREIPGIVPVQVEVAKEGRWSAAAPYVAAGNVYLPGPGLARAWTHKLRAVAAQPESWLDPKDVHETWVEELIGELATVPKAAFNDQADATSQAILKMAQPTQQDGPRTKARTAAAAAGAIAAME